MSNEVTSTRKPGRPPVVLNWPDGEFSVEQLEQSTGLSKVTLYQKVKTAKSNNVITISGKENSKQGRPRTLFRRVVSNVESTPQPVELLRVALP